ncbi:MAG: helix-turn-helix domain-containing protein [Rhodocyclaceae bacterium]|nr:helix-turn-helix domain-containing protein [Rhodocyclaceae bacterium]
MKAEDDPALEGAAVMPWEQKTVIERREEFVLFARQTGNFSVLCREWGISYKTGYKWLRRAEAGEALDDRSRRPKRVSNRTPDARTHPAF